MKTFARLASCSSPFALALLYMTLTTNAQAPRHQLAVPLSPISSGVLVAQMIHSSRMPLPAIENLLKPTTHRGLVLRHLASYPTCKPPREGLRLTKLLWYRTPRISRSY